MDFKGKSLETTGFPFTKKVFSIVMGVSQNGLFHGKSHEKMDDIEVPPILGHLQMGNL